MWALTSDCSAVQVDGRASPRELWVVIARVAAVAALCTVIACGSSPDDGPGSSSTTDAGGSSEADASSSGDAPGSSSSTSGGGSASDSTGQGETASTGEASASSSGTGEDTSSGTGSSSSGETAACGDGQLDPGEDCDDGNLDAGDGCDATCKLERWEHVGVANYVAVADLVGWELCWSGSYGAGDKVASVTAACKGDHLMMACRPKGDAKLTVAAHAPREDVLFPVDYGAGERHEANGVNWYWSPTSNIEGFAPAGSTEGCEANTDGIQPDYLCWVNADDDPLTFEVGRRCSSSIVNAKDANSMERLVFQAWD